MFRKFVSLSCFVMASAVALVPLSVAQASEPTGSVVHYFRGPDGEYPNPTLTQDSAGNLYATAAYGGNTAAAACPANQITDYGGCGAVVKLNAPNWSINVLAAFSDPKGPIYPNGGVYVDKTGAVYGTSRSGGANGYGTFFKLTPPTAGHTVWKQTVLHSFTICSAPSGNLIADASGSLYVAATNDDESGKVCNPNVTWDIVKLTPSASGAWTTSVITSVGNAFFTSPIEDLAIDSTGTLYVTTSDFDASYDSCSGTGGCGQVWKIAPPRKGGSSWTRTALYTFNVDDGTPSSGVVIGEDGTLYGVTDAVIVCGPGCGGGVIKGLNERLPLGFGIQPGKCSQPCSNVYKLTAESTMGALNKTIISYIYPSATPVKYSAGALYVGASFANQGTEGVLEGETLFKLTPKSTGNLWHATALYSFPEHDAEFFDDLLLGKNGVIYATAPSTALTSKGTIVEVTP